MTTPNTNPPGWTFGHTSLSGKLKDFYWWEYNGVRYPADEYGWIAVVDAQPPVISGNYLSEYVLVTFAQTAWMGVDRCADSGKWVSHLPTHWRPRLPGPVERAK